ncbi:MAG: SDR family NAD(P)-dependent oxidoreductase, partial [Saprospiraceae bacterium]|nr:SDR family NAD(P)-dependent oxidoreductase [Saprospiraceae bacterium]
MQLLKDKVAVVTGGSRGIGEAIVRCFAEQGATVIFTYMSSREKAEGIAAEIGEAGGTAIAIHSDASSFV